MKDHKIELIKNLRYVIPYIKTYKGKVFVIMLNGEAIKHTNFSNIINDIIMLNNLGIRLVLVYGARPQIDTNLALHNIQSIYHKNIRVTDILTMEKIKQVVGQLQLDITSLLSINLKKIKLYGVNINVVSGNFIIAQPLGIYDGIDYSYSGCIRKIDCNAIQSHLNNGTVVLLGPIAGSVTGESFNLLSEEIATQLAIKLKAEKIIGFCSSKNIFNNNIKLIPNEAQKLINQLETNNEHDSNTLYFLRGAVKACRNGVKNCHLINYQEDGAIINKLFSNEIGVQVIMEGAEQIRHATIDDIDNIIELIHPLEQQGILIHRSRKQLEMEIDKFIIIKLNNLIIACAALYPFMDDQIGELSCVAVHPDYRSSSRGELLLAHITQQAQQMGLKKLFVLTTRSIHWFQERGFIPSQLEMLPTKKKELYNYHRRSKILIADL